MNGGLKVLYASQTGTSKDLAFDVAEWIGQTVANVECLNIADYKAMNLASEKSLIVFVISTCGQGEVPDDMKLFWKFLLQKRLPANSIPKLSYCIIGLGDKSYPLYNYAAKKLEARLQYLGAKSFIDCWLCDEDTLGADYWSWQSKAKELFGMKSKALEILPKRLKYENVRFGSAEGKEDFGEWSDVLERVNLNKHTAKVRVNCYSEPGDILYVYPSNKVPEVLPASRIKGRVERNEPLEDLVKRWGIDRDLNREVVCDKKAWSGQSLRSILWNVLDVYGPITSLSLRVAAYYSSYDQEQKETITEMAQNSWSDMTREFIYLRNVPKLFEEFKTNVQKIPIELFVNCFKELQSRAYSIAMCDKGKTTVIVSSHQKADPFGRLYFGRCTSSLFAPEINRFRVEVKPGSLSQKHFQSGKPVLMIVVGTGLASVLSFVNSREPPYTGPWVMYQGCRHEGLEKDLIDEFLKKGSLSQYHLALSFPEKVYAWHLILRDSKMIFENFLSRQDSTIVIGGSVSNGFARDVSSVFCTILKENVPDITTKEQAENVVRNMEMSGRIVFDVYG